MGDYVFIGKYNACAIKDELATLAKRFVPRWLWRTGVGEAKEVEVWVAQSYEDTARKILGGE